MSEEFDEIIAPRKTEAVYGQSTASEQFLSAINTSRLHHAWLLSGPNSCGKASFAYVAAKKLLSSDPVRGDEKSLSVSGDLSAAIKVAAGSHSDLMLLSRKWDSDAKRMTTGIPVDEVRRLNRFFGSTAGEGGWRIVIVDKAEDLNNSAANALLKLLEEPPQKSIFLLLSDNPNQLLPTIKSRCRRLNFRSLEKHAIASILTNLNQGKAQTKHLDLETIKVTSMRKVLKLAGGNSTSLEGDILGLLDASQNAIAAHSAVIDKICSRNNDAHYQEFIELAEEHVYNMSKSSMHKLEHKNYLVAWQEIASKQKQTETFNLDKKQLVLDVLSLIRTSQMSTS